MHDWPSAVRGSAHHSTWLLSLLVGCDLFSNCRRTQTENEITIRDLQVRCDDHGRMVRNNVPSPSDSRDTSSQRDLTNI
ncbi:hypothetical protein DFH29DRAFT_383275 [Suillus ampliporus]|nr:hypothetical protein DFH29DRAFT_383275 [Suillus ampliporus]